MPAMRIDYDAAPWKKVRHGDVRYKPIKLENFGASMVSFVAGAKEGAHSHEDAQLVFCLKGRIEFYVKDEVSERTEILTPGIALALPPGVVHGAHATEESLIFAVWNPMERFTADSIVV